jgi:hypothetical protein
VFIPTNPPNACPLAAIRIIEETVGLTPLHIRIAEEYRAAGMREDNFSPNIGFMANDPLRVVKSKIQFVL